MTITLPEEWRSRIEERAKANGFHSVSEYVMRLVEGETEFSRSSRTPRNREELESMLDEGMKGPILTLTEVFWEKHQKRLDRDDGDSV